jgi:protein-disulfide isomerase
MSRSLEPIDRPRTLAVPIDRSRDHVLGPIDAPITLLEYGDYECPDCGRAYPLLKELQKRFENKLLFVFRHYPQFTIHRHASTAAQAAEAAAAQGKFWKMHDLLYGDQSHLERTDLTHHALRLGLDPYAFDAALGNGVYEKRVEEDFLGGKNSGVRGTPTLFINERRHLGDITLEALSAAIEQSQISNGA